MSAGGGENVETTNSPVRLESRQGSEPADPDVPDHNARRGLPLVPDSVKNDRLPAPFVSNKGEVLTVAEAGETYLQIQRANRTDDTLTSKHERHRFSTYPRILEADRHFRMSYDGLTTALLTRRLSPLDSSDRWLTPWECNEMLHGGSIHRSVTGALRRQFGAFEFEWVAVTAPTESAGTPHEHIYLWINDPDNDVKTEYLESGLDKHLKHCTNAYEEDHCYRSDGTGGAITVQHEPDLRRAVNKGVAKHIIRGNTPPLSNTAGAQYLASQLAHLPLSDFYDTDEDDPPQPLFEGAALAWVSPYNWFRSSQGVPS